MPSAFTPLYPRYAQLPRLDRSHPPVHTYHYAEYAPESGYRLRAYKVVWDVPLIWDAILTQLSRVAAGESFACWLDSPTGDDFLAEHQFGPVQCDGVLQAPSTDYFTL